MNFTVESVREQGCKVRVFHRRRYLVSNKPLGTILSPSDLDKIKTVLLPACCVDDVNKALPTGGCTSVEVTMPNGDRHVAHAQCFDSDHYNRKRGVRIALNRAMLSDPV